MQTHVQEIWAPYGGCTWTEDTYYRWQPRTSACSSGTAQGVGSKLVLLEGLSGQSVSGCKHPGGRNCTANFCTHWPLTHTLTLEKSVAISLEPDSYEEMALPASNRSETLVSVTAAPMSTTDFTQDLPCSLQRHMRMGSTGPWGWWLWALLNHTHSSL